MGKTRDIIGESQEFVLNLLEQRLAPWTVYHDVRHTEETVEACREIGGASGLNEAEMEILLLAAWFHDTGYIETVRGHEERSVTIAGEFLRERSYPEEGIERISGCIMATKMPQSPKNLLEKIICDADMIYLGKEGFFAKNDLLKAEIEKRENRVIPDVDWLKRSVDFLSGQSYHTEYALKNLQDGIRINIGVLQEQIRRAQGLRTGT